MPNKLSKMPAQQRRAAVALLVLVFVAVGLVSLTVGRAASYVLHVEAESGTKAGAAVAGPSLEASGAASVKFGGTNCALPKYPDATCTGVPAGTQLTAMVPAGNITIDEPNTVIEGKEITGCISILAPGVVIKRSKITCPSLRTAILMSDVRLPDNTVRYSSLTLEDVELNCGQTTTGIEGHDLTLRRILVQGCTSAIRTQSNLVVEDSFFRYMRNPVSGINPIAAGVQFTLVTTATARIQHNSFDATGGGWGVDLGSQKQGAQISVLNNSFIGGTRPLACPFNSSVNPIGAIRLVGNRFTSASPKADVMSFCADELEVRDNAYLETGVALP